MDEKFDDIKEVNNFNSLMERKSMKKKGNQTSEKNVHKDDLTNSKEATMENGNNMVGGWFVQNYDSFHKDSNAQVVKRYTYLYRF